MARHCLYKSLPIALLLCKHLKGAGSLSCHLLHSSDTEPTGGLEFAVCALRPLFFVISSSWKSLSQDIYSLLCLVAHFLYFFCLWKCL